MQFIKQINGLSPVFYVWSIEELKGDLLPNNFKIGRTLRIPSIRMPFQLILPFLLSGIKLFAFKFYR